MVVAMVLGLVQTPLQNLQHLVAAAVTEAKLVQVTPKLLREAIPVRRWVPVTMEILEVTRAMEAGPLLSRATVMGLMLRGASHVHPRLAGTRMWAELDCKGP